MEQTEPALEFKDRSGALAVFGVLEIILGGLCALFVPCVFLGQALSAHAGLGPANYRLAIPGALFYAFAALVFIWLGIGSIKCRRWARALWLIVGWSWLIIGVPGILAMALVLPQTLEAAPAAGQPLPAVAKAMAMVFAMTFAAVIYIVLPGALVLFYRSEHVKKTCEAHNPAPCWTDACPLPVLGAALWLGVGALAYLQTLAWNSVTPCFGVLLSGLPGTLYVLCLAALWAWLGWGIYRRQPAAWWIALIVAVLMGLSAYLTFQRVDIMEMYRLMGMPAEQLARFEKARQAISQFMTVSVVLFLAFFIGFMLWIRRHFVRVA